MKIIETPHLLHRQPTEDDVRILSKLWRNKIVRTYLGGILSDEVIKKKITLLQRHWEQYEFGVWAVCDENTKQVIGLCGPHHSDEGIEISYMFFPEFWGKDFARESVIASIDYSFQVLKLDALIAITQLANLKSCSLLKKVGMKHVNNFERFNATQCMYRITREEWQNNFTDSFHL